jgi:hypothetical protein
MSDDTVNHIPYINLLSSLNGILHVPAVLFKVTVLVEFILKFLLLVSIMTQYNKESTLRMTAEILSSLGSCLAIQNSHKYTVPFHFLS